MRLLLIRHGQTPANVDGIIESTFPGPGLTLLGHEQAAAIPDAVADEPIDSISVSRMVRTHLTAAPLAAARGLDPIERPGIHEIEAGDYEGMPTKDAIHGYRAPLLEWARGDLSARMPGGSDGHEFFAIFDADVAAIEQSGSRCAVIVSHSAAIRTWVGGRAGNIVPMFAAEQELHNTGIVIVEGTSAGGWTLVSWQGEPVEGTSIGDPDEMADPLDE
jgi:broad specificity phosphatase PhoE